MGLPHMYPAFFVGFARGHSHMYPAKLRRRPKTPPAKLRWPANRLRPNFAGGRSRPGILR